MKCPKCSHSEDKVVDSRSARNDSVIRRRRMCIKCGHRYTTYEEVVKPNLRVTKRDGRHEELSREKLVSGIQIACQKRPIRVDQIEDMADSLIDELESEFEKEVPSQVIGQKVMAKLETLDEIEFAL